MSNESAGESSPEGMQQCIMIGKTGKCLDIYIGMSPESQAEFGNSSIIPVEVSTQRDDDGNVTKTIAEILQVGADDATEKLRVFVVPMSSGVREQMQAEMMYLVNDVIPAHSSADAEDLEADITEDMPAA